MNDTPGYGLAQSRSASAPAPSAAQAATGPHSPPAGLLPSGRTSATTGVSEKTASLVHELIALSGHQTTADTPSLAQHLPELALEKIFSYLPFSCLCQCARVCRHWYDCLPPPRERLSRWLHKNAPLSCQPDPELGRGFTSRTRPFLQTVGSPVLPALMHLHKEAHLQQDKQELKAPELSGAHQDLDTQQAQQPTTADLFPRLLHYALQRQQVLANSLTLRPHAIDWPDSTLVGGMSFSPCCRWLALSCRIHARAPAHLRLYSWGPDSWQQCSLKPCVLEPVTAFLFTRMPPGTLFSTHGTDVLAWRREPGTNDWHRTHVCRMPWLFRVCDLLPMDNGDLVAFAQKRSGTTKVTQAIFSAFLGNERGWQAATMPKFVSKDPRKNDCYLPSLTWAGEGRSSQLALGMITQRQGPAHCINEVQIWRKGLNVPSSHSLKKWGYQTSILAWHQADITALAWSPGGHCLLGILSDGRMCLWTQDAQHRLQEQLTLTGYPTPLSYKPAELPLFCDQGKQLALPLSVHQVQLCYSDDSGGWQQGQRLETMPDPDVPPDDSVEYMQLSSSGRTLIRTTRWRLDIWYRHSAHGWQHRVQRKRKNNAEFMPQACLLSPFDIVCSTAEDPRLSLWIHGVDSQGQLVRKACLRVDTAINGPLAASPTGCPYCWPA